ncbi:MAG: hypothetical protein HY909_12510 [Deltaproteobacteria bacterium]|nr:hypothetical protein [Deltaproteobacteria bacterium]
MNCRALWVPLLGCVLGCTTCPADPAEFRGLRVLGVTREPAVGAPGGRVTLTMVSTDVEAREPAVAWYRCPLSGGNLGASRETSGVDEPGVVFARQCLAAGQVARGRTATVELGPPVPQAPLGGLTSRLRWDYLGFACPSGELEEPPPGGLWPRCSGATGVLFRVTVPGPYLDGRNPLPVPVGITAVRFGPEGAEAPITEDAPPEVARCEAPRSRCPVYRFTLETAPPGLDLRGDRGSFDARASQLQPGAYRLVALYDAIAPAEAPLCAGEGLGAAGVSDGSLRWSSAPGAGDARVFLVVLGSDGGFAWARRTVRVR